MRKHLKFRGRLIPPEFKEVEVTLLEQSHFSMEFGDEDYDFCTKEFRLVSLSDKLRPHDSGWNCTPQLAIPDCGESPAPIKVTLDFWNKLKQAVEIYNNYEF